MKLGVDYYPEHRPEERWAIDAALMSEAGLGKMGRAVGAVTWH